MTHQSFLYRFGPHSYPGGLKIGGNTPPPQSEGRTAEKSARLTKVSRNCA